MFGLLFWFLIFLFCLFLLIKSSDKLVDSAKNLGLLLNIPSIIIGIVFLSFGTTLPEMITGIISTVNGYSEIGISNVIGTMIINILIIIILIGFIKKEYELKTNLRKDVIFLNFLTLLFIFFIIDFKYTIIEGLISIFLLLTYVIYLCVSRERIIDSQNNFGLTKQQTIRKIINKSMIMIVCFVTLYFSSKYLILSIVNISDIIGISKSIMAITIVAIGTSLPEIFVGISAIKKQEIELTLGNIIGANVINGLGVAGLSVFFGNIMVSNVAFFAIPSLVLTTTFFVIIINRKKINWMHSIFAATIYLAFIIGLIFLI